MAVERTVESQGLVRRIGAKAKVVVDEAARPGDRVAAGAVVSGVAAGGVAGAFAAFEVVDKLILGNPAVAQFMGTDLAHSGEWGMGGAAAVGVVSYLLTGIAAEESGNKGATAYLAGHNAVGRVRAVSLVVGGTLGVLAGALAGADATGLAHMGGVDAGLFDATFAAAGAAVGTTGLRLLTRMGTGPARPQKQLAE